MHLCDYFQKNIAPKNGYYIEIGAYNGKGQNSTLVLEQNGWQGVCVEPIESNFHQLIERRSCKCIQGAVYNRSGTVTIVDVDKRGWTGIKETHHPKHKKRYILPETREIEVPCYTFDEITDRTHVDYLQIDVEGAEAAILKSIDWEKYTIDYICIEDNLRVEEDDDSYYELMTSLGYTLVHEMKQDFLYKRN